VEVSKPGQIFGIIEVTPIKIDSTFGYPIEEKEVTAYTLVDRNTHKQIEDNSYCKIYFSKKNEHYIWQIQRDPFLANYIYSDTIKLKPNTWYRLTIENSAYHKYFYWSGAKAEYIIKEKPRTFNY
jgi:hypothetical protein